MVEELHSATYGSESDPEAIFFRAGGKKSEKRLN